MDHAEAHERLADLALEPGRLIDLEADPTPEERALLAHAETCSTCRAELADWRRTHSAVLAASTTGGIDPTGRLEIGSAESSAGPPTSLRVAVADIPRHSPRLLDPASERPGARMNGDEQRSRWRTSAVAAVIIVGLCVGLGAIAADQVQRADVARQQVRALVGLSTSLDRVLRDDGHTAIALVGLDGAPGGTAAWSSSEIVIMTTALTSPGPDAEYRCWVERDGQRTAIGAMRFADGVAYWWGSLDRYDGTPLDGGGRLGVSLEQTGQSGSHAPVLLGELPS
ncbi:MAG: anti-sigma factor [Candidatus Limnocylindrales bacterium]